MLSQSVYIYNASSLGSGKYQFELYFQNITQGQFLNLGDLVRDKQGREYEIIFPTSLPHTDGNVVVTQFVTTDTLPSVDEDYDSIVFTPSQVDVRPYVRTSGALANPSLYSGPNYEYNVLAGWDLAIEGDQAQIGDYIVDSNGKEYELTYLHPSNRWNSLCRIKEVIREGVAPAVGDASMYRPTPNFKLFQGTPISDPARTVVRNRDSFLLDSKLQDIMNQIGEARPAGEVEILNGTGDTLTRLQPVSLDSFGKLVPTDVTDEAIVKSLVGLVKTNTATNLATTVVTSGKIENITTTASFGDLLYVSKTNSLTNIPPDIGISGFAAGDFVVAVGKVAMNLSNPTIKDLIINPILVGQL